MSALDAMAADWPALSPLLDEALALPAGAREAWLAGRSGLSTAQRQLLHRLLAQQAVLEKDDFLQALPAAPVPPADNGPAAGDRVGPWQLLRELGHGGMGSVWLAERADGGLKRRAALKLPRLSWVRGLAERMARERDILASLDHPCIARLYDAGVDAQGRPWLALEYVEGLPVDQACRERGLGLRERVQFLAQVCDAVAYAHSRLVIHRDLKPSNLLMDAQGQARLLDFGIAKLAQEGADASAVTELAGTAFTVGYASPEQLGEAALGTASDVFSLGVVGFELLTGRLPWVVEGRSALAYERALAQSPAPLASRVTDDAAWAAQLRGDLDAVLDRALQREPSRRYAGAEGLAADLRAWLAGDPVSARRRARREQLRYWVRRHRSAVLAGSLVLLTLAAATAVSIHQAVRARREAAHAEAEAARARREAARASATQALLTRIFQLNSVDQPDPLQAQRTTVRELLDFAARSVEDVMRDAPEAQVEMLGTLSGLYAQLGAATPATQAARSRVELARRALPDNDARRAEALLVLAGRLHDTPERATARALIEEAEQVLARAGPDGEAQRGHVLMQRGRHERWGPLRRALTQIEAAVVWYREHQPDASLRSTTLYHAAVIADLAGEPAAGLRHLDEARKLASARGALGGRALLTAVAERGDLLMRRGLWDQADAAHAEAVAAAQRLLGADSRTTLITQIQRARFLIDTGRVPEGEALWAQVQQRMAALRPSLESWWVDYASGLMNRLTAERGRPDLLEAPARAALARALETVPDSSVTVQRRLALGGLLLDLGRVAEATAQWEQAVALWQRVGAGLAPASPMDEQLVLLQARLQLARQQPDAALDLLARQPRNRALAPEAPDSGAARRWLLRASALQALGRPEEALAAVVQAEAELQKLPAPLRWPALAADAALAQSQALRALGRRREADAALQRAAAERRAFDLPGSLALARVLAEQRRERS